MGATRAALSRTRRRRPARAGGFTLIEILVVVVIIGLISVSLLLSVNLTGRDSELEKESQRITELVNLAREQAELQTREYGLLCQEDSYEFVSYDVRHNLWRTIPEDDTLRQRKLPRGIDLKLVVEGHPVVLNHPKEKDDPTAKKPQIMIFSNGDLTSFEMTVQRTNGSHGVRITQDDKGQLVQKPTVEAGRART
jgi:general secretion pathway protein H